MKCSECGDDFVSARGSSRAKYCSLACQRIGWRKSGSFSERRAGVKNTRAKAEDTLKMLAERAAGDSLDQIAERRGITKQAVSQRLLKWT